MYARLLDEVKRTQIPILDGMKRSFINLREQGAGPGALATIRATARRGHPRGLSGRKCPIFGTGGRGIYQASSIPLTSRSTGIALEARPLLRA